MKKLITLASAILLSLALVSCGKKIDSTGWLSNLEDGKKAASAEGKKILLFFSTDDSDKKSANLKNQVFKTEEFLKAYTEKYILVNLDYSNERYNSAPDGIKKDLRTFDVYSAKGTPYFLVLSAEGYVITPLAFNDDTDFATVRTTFNEAEEAINKFDELLEKTKTGTTEEKLAAINEIVENTDPSVSYHLTPLNKLYLSLDKGNKTGDSLKHLIAITYAKAEDHFLDNEPEKASEEFVKLSKNKILSEEDRQIAFYTAGYLLASSGSNNLEKILSYFQKAYDINPESEAAKNIKISLDYVKAMIENEGDESLTSDVVPASEESSN